MSSTVVDSREETALASWSSGSDLRGALIDVHSLCPYTPSRLVANSRRASNLLSQILLTIRSPLNDGLVVSISSDKIYKLLAYKFETRWMRSKSLHEHTNRICHISYGASNKGYHSFGKLCCIISSVSYWTD